ncbi:Uncharacterised protein [Vibrio cholerae]|uniref:Uncharacterized protein n=1 Tax=Vibrio cholerae TaxID=666 RepID=A0A655ZTQ8_VIBCL|nr:Uncharacterised protein [Vibrio cholerae]CSB22477.1 Uncharacterised protein [Vibrio cholerae]CSB27559.1 Uncharacterised protein [Vibrio cholerae]CSB60824.1 Uncharacterised protein [Vibrio cholerae]CSB60947.1 Uncharacterised protein [Vibrio cholerae]
MICSLGIKKRLSPEKPTTSASISPFMVSTLHKLPTGALQPVASSVKPTTRTNFPEAMGRVVCPSTLYWARRSANANIGYSPGW